MTRQVRALAAAALGAAIVATGSALADGGKPQIKFTAADQTAAHAAVIRRSDLGSASGWTGGARKPDLSAGPTCSNYHPKRSDLVLTGAAETVFQNGQLEFDGEAVVLRTAQMVQLDWQREVQAPGATACLRSYLTKTLGSTANLVSFAKLSIPQIATYTAGFRIGLEIRTNGKAASYVLEALLIGRGRTEITLSSFTPAAAQTTVAAATLRLAKLLIGRARA
jgi:hypothetical protein